MIGSNELPEMLKGREKVEKYLSKYGWVYNILDEDTIVTGFKGESDIYTLFIHCVGGFFFLSIYNLIENPDENCISQLQNYLLTANYHIISAKFSLDKLSRIVLTVELSEKVATYDFFVSSLDLLANTIDEQIPFLKEAAFSKSFENPYISEPDMADGEI